MTMLTRLMAAERQRELVRLAAERRRHSPGRLARRSGRDVPLSPPEGAPERLPDCGLAPRPTVR